MKKFLLMILSVALIFFAGCGGIFDSEKNYQTNKTVIGVSMPTEFAPRWIHDGENIKTNLTAAGYVVDLKYAGDDIKMQIQQISEMIDSGVSCLVIASIDSTKLVEVLERAKQKNISVIAYDRLLMDTDSISYYATFDNKEVGILIGRYVEEKLNLKTADKTFNVEFFAGSPDDNNAHFLNDGVFEILQPYIDSGKLKVLSGETDFDKICTLRWSEDVARERMRKILKTYYQDKKIDAVISPYDGISYGILDALKNSGYKVGKDMPLITGQDADLKAIKSILSGEQSMTIFKDTRVLAGKCVIMVEAVLEGRVPEINDTSSYNNHKFIVPSYLCKPVVIDKENIDDKLIKSGYYSTEEVYD